MKWLLPSLLIVGLLIAGCANEVTTIKKETPPQDQVQTQQGTDDISGYEEIENADTFDELETSSEDLGLDGFEDLNY